MKKTISLILVLVFCLSLCACGSDSQAKETEPLNSTIPVQNTVAYDSANSDAILEQCR